MDETLKKSRRNCQKLKQNASCSAYFDELSESRGELCAVLNEFNDLTRKMSSLKQTLKDFDTSRRIKSRECKSASTCGASVITGVSGVKEIISECIARFVMIQNFLDGNTENVDLLEKLRKILTTATYGRNAAAVLTIDSVKAGGKDELILLKSTSRSNVDKDTATSFQLSEPKSIGIETEVVATKNREVSPGDTFHRTDKETETTAMEIAVSSGNEAAERKGGLAKKRKW